MWERGMLFGLDWFMLVKSKSCFKEKIEVDRWLLRDIRRKKSYERFCVQ